MAEVLRDLVVTLSLQSDNFSRNIATINKQIREAESEFKLAGAGIENYGQTTEGLSTRLNTMQQVLTHHQNSVSQYQRMLTAASTRLSQSKSNYDDYNKKLDEARVKHEDLGKALKDQTELVQTLKDAGYENTMWYRDEADELARMSQEYAASGENVKLLEGQVASLQKTMQNAANAELDAETKLNNAKAAVKETEAAIKQLSAQLKTAQSSWTTAGTALTNFSRKAGEVGQAFGAIGKSLTLRVTAPIVALGKSVMQASIDFESSFASVRKTVDATESEFQALANQSKEMSTQVAASTTEINEVMATGGQLGIATEHLTEFTRTMIDLGNSCEDLDASNAADQIAKFANVMNTSQDKFSNIGSVVVDLGNNFATTEGPIVEMAQRLAGAGKQVGLTEAQVLALAASLSSVGIKAQMGGSAMSKALIKMEVAARTGNKELKDFAKVSNMTEAEFVKTWSRDPIEAFQAFISGVAHMSEEGESAVKVLDDIGIKEIRLRDTLLRSVNAHELFARAQQRANVAWRENTALQTEANKRYATMESRLTNLKNKAVLFAQTLGNDMRPMINNVMEGVAGYIDKLMDMDESQRRTLLTNAAIAASIGPVLLVFGKLAQGASKVMGVLASFATSVGAAGGGWAGFLSVLAKSPAVWLAVGAAVVYGTVKLIDWASGAKRAREATQGLIDTANEWKSTAADTFYGKDGGGLSFFGLSSESFSSDKTVASSKAWIKGLLEVWTDGKGESDEIVNEWTDSWKKLTDNTRTQLQNFADVASESGQTEVASQVQEDIDTLDKMDKEVEALLKKRQNGYLSSDEQIHLQDLIDQREALIVKYKLQPESDVEGFQSIMDKVQAEVRRAQARGEADADVTVYQNAVVAAAQGLAAMNASIDEQYDKEYSVIQLIEDQAKREQALAELNDRYNTQRQAAAQDYAQTLSQVMGPVLEAESMKETGKALDDVSGKLSKYDAAVKLYGKDSGQATKALEEVTDAAKNLDEGNLTEYAAALSQITELIHSGMSEEEVQAMFPQIDISQSAEQLAAIQEFSKTYSDTLSGLSSMFGEGLAQEVVTIATSLDLTGAQADWAGFAENPGAITTTAIVESIEEGEKAKAYQLKVTAAVDKFVNEAGNAAGDLTVHGVVAEVVSYIEAEGIDPKKDLKPGDIEALVNKIVLATGYDKATVEAALTDLVGEVTAYDDSGATPPQPVAKLAIDGYDLAALDEFTKNNPIEIKGIVRVGDKYETPEDVLDDENAKFYYNGEEIPVNLVPAEKLTADTIIAYDNDGTIHVLLTPEINGSAESLEMTESMMKDSDMSIFHWDISTEEAVKDIQALIANVQMFKEQAEQAGDEVSKALNESYAKGAEESLTDQISELDDVDVSNIAYRISDLMAALDSGTGTPEQITAWRTELEGLLTFVNSIDPSATTATGTNIMAGIAEGMNTYSFGDTAETAKTNIVNSINSALGVASPATSMFDTGEQVSAGIAEGMGLFDFSAAAAAITAAIQAAIPADLLVNVGTEMGGGLTSGIVATDTNGSAGILAAKIKASVGAVLNTSTLRSAGQNAARGLVNGLASASVGTAGSSVAAKVKSSVNANLNATSLRSAGENAMRGLAAGITSGAALAAAAARAAAAKAAQAAKDALQIKSPSRVFRDEIGLMMMRGLGEGVKEGLDEQARAIRNAAKYLSGEAQEGIVTGSVHTDNRKTYHQETTLSITGNTFSIRDESDIHKLATELAAMTNRYNAGVGVRNA